MLKEQIEKPQIITLFLFYEKDTEAHKHSLTDLTERTSRKLKSEPGLLSPSLP